MHYHKSISLENMFEKGLLDFQSEQNPSFTIFLNSVEKALVVQTFMFQCKSNNLVQYIIYNWSPARTFGETVI